MNYQDSEQSKKSLKIRNISDDNLSEFNRDPRLQKYVPRDKSLLLFKFLLGLNRMNTRRAYYFDLLDFFEFYSRFKSSKLDWVRVSLDDINFFKESLKRGKLKGHRLSDASVKRKVTALSRFFKFLITQNIILSNPCEHVQRPSVPLEVKTKVISKDEFKALLKVLEDRYELKSLTSTNKYALRYSFLLHRSIVLVLFSTGIRVGELLSLRWKDLEIESLDKARLYIRSHKSQKGLIKNLSPLVVKSLLEFKNHINNEVDTERLIPTKYNQEMFIFKALSSTRDSISAQAIRKVLETLSLQAGISIKVTPHVARTFYITQGLEVTDIGSMGRDVGHSSVVMTHEYDKRRKNISAEVAEHIFQ